MSRLYIPVGIPGCGKSTLARNMLPDARVISSDAIRLEHGHVYDASKNPVIFEVFHERIVSSLLHGQDVYADATNLADFARKNLRDKARQARAETHVIFFTNVAQAIARNAQRTEALVPADVMANKMIPQYEQALCDIPREVYNTVTYIGGIS